METLFHTLLTLLLFVAISQTLPPLAGSFPISNIFPAVFNFGDSNSDTGELSSGLGFLPQPSYEKTYFRSPTSGRFCNGRLIVDFLMEAIDRPYLRPYLDSISRQSYRRGCNFAAAASTIQKANAASYSPFGFGVQVSQFITFKSKVLQLIQQDEELGRYLPSEYYFKKGLYMFDIGQNDIAGAFYSKTLDEVLALVPTILDIFQDGIKLHGLFKKLPQQYPDSRFTYVDIFSIKSDLILNHSKYGFDHSITVCCGTGGPPLNYDDQVGCGKTARSNGTIKTAKPCYDSSKYVNWDGIHYTEAANRYVALHILTGKYSETASSLNL
ncbi:GDSL esterase/lipase At3g05180 isoform X2 [Arabidopsis lyrata subsp. lyrata]|uniref:GDSL esterase/lipase At3g05180 isoform X2 n=1 Tax=Arabidopsis lyrata subsp. lyrata TaxID=81972 RepID=UPI000A29CFF5|nr:GDSL esterase/lipase At3g05180 isoform X2 [Arabidopsis lyrata subsp. lyrata]|eukprot:XP_020888652.1 GDSL esterase/lipase At3g05180 isoform X2 [Arabidopsis lyrata subsp. lyrata]